MKRILTLALMMVTLLALGAGAVVAADQVIRCKKIPCVATGDNDLVYERRGDRKADKIKMRGGNDKVLANKYTHDKDVVRGGSGFDKINVADGDHFDKVYGGKGRSWCIVDSDVEVGGGCTRITDR